MDDIENKDSAEEIEKTPAELDKEIESLTLKEFNAVLDEIFKDSTISDVEKILTAKELHKIAKREFTYETIGKILGISKVGAKKVEERALKKLRKEMKKAGLSMDDFL